MARYTDAVCRLCRREGMKLFLKGERCFTRKCAFERRPSIPGVHPWKRQKTEYGRRLREKQKVKRYYGILDKQFKKYFRQAERLRGDTGLNLLLLLERRLDNVLRRLGLAVSVAQARQFILHRHILLNNRLATRPSILVKKGDTISVAEKEKSQNLIKQNLNANTDLEPATWLSFSEDTLEGVVLELPIREEIPIQIEEQLIVEFASK
ncbi:MAG: 30S ribosomal protein S4 [Planctomycetota bacterium]|nr:MAG: 30S ribosomal protein S4 [Planctomycetota bacterium]